MRFELTDIQIWYFEMKKANVLVGLPLVFALVGAFFGVAEGYRYFKTVPPAFTAQSLFQIVRSVPTAHGGDQPLPNSTALDHSLILRSQRVLRDAVVSGRLAENLEFQDMDRDAIVSQLMQSKNLQIKEHMTEPNRQLVTLSFTCGDADLSATCLNSIVDSFVRYHKDSEGSQVSVKELNRSVVGTFSGPMLLPFLILGGLSGLVLAGLPALLLTLIAYSFFTRKDRARGAVT